MTHTQTREFNAEIKFTTSQWKTAIAALTESKADILLSHHAGNAALLTQNMFHPDR